MKYQQLWDGFSELSLLQESAELLNWDAAVVMPAHAAERRGRQLAALGGVVYEKLEVLAHQYRGEGVEDCPEDAWNQANLHGMLTEMDEVLLVPKDLQQHLRIAKTSCEMAWRGAKADGDFSLVESKLQELVSLSRQALFAKAEAKNIGLMDAALDKNEKGLTTEKVEVLLEKHAAFLKDFYPKAIASSDQRIAEHGKDICLSVEQQKILSHAVCKRMGLPENESRIDESAHPFSSSYPSDTRITLRFEEDEPLQSLWAGIHETGHSLYECQLPKEWVGQPVGTSLGNIIHESQSLSMEKQAGLHPNFLEWLTGFLNDELPLNIPLNRLKSNALCVARTPIRVSSDEVSYPLHILLRFRLEKAILLDDMPIKNLPEAFRSLMEELIGLKITDDRQGCLQDIHWYVGEFGYFPCYALGAMAAAQLSQKAFSENSQIEQEFADGRFDLFRDWMGQHIHAKASLYDAETLVSKVTGEVLSHQYLAAHVQKRYGQ